MINSINRFVEEAKDLKVLIVGETITDQFYKVIYEGHSMKSFCPVFQLINEPPQVQEGGALAIANHIRDFVQKVDLLTNDPSEIVKTRYMDAHSLHKHVEINHIHLEPTKNKIPQDEYDVIIIADFGHGFCDQLDLPDGVHLMCQTNSNNFGFNRVSKWKSVNKTSVCIDLREASLQMNMKVGLESESDLKELYNYEINSRDLYVTQGRSGVIFTNGEKTEQFPAFKTEVADTIGAGDAFFAFASLMSHLNWPEYDRLSIPSLAASITTTWLANEHHVTKDLLIQHAERNL
jgi:bifunctional ADP-heptose synthase (sugar kinase/adenylyltransferase)